MRGGISIDITNLCETSNYNYIEIEDNQGEKYEINGGERNFNVESYEIYQINW